VREELHTATERARPSGAKHRARDQGGNHRKKDKEEGQRTGPLTRKGPESSELPPEKTPVGRGENKERAVDKIA